MQICAYVIILLEFIYTANKKVGKYISSADLSKILEGYGYNMNRRNG